MIKKPKIWLVRGTSGATIAAFKTKKDAYLYASRKGLIEWHIAETNFTFDGIEWVYIEKSFLDAITIKNGEET